MNHLCFRFLPPQKDGAGPWQCTHQHNNHPVEVFTCEVVYGSAPKFERGKSKFEHLADLINENLNPNARYRPFADCREWEMVEWLVKAGLSQSVIDDFLKLEVVCSYLIQ